MMAAESVKRRRSEPSAPMKFGSDPQTAAWRGRAVRLMMTYRSTAAGQCKGALSQEIARCRLTILHFLDEDLRPSENLRGPVQLPQAHVVLGLVRKKVVASSPYAGGSQDLFPVSLHLGQ
jgi:hypothetical protein